MGLVALDPVRSRGDARVPLATHEWGDGTVAPAGHVHLEAFAIVDGVPCWRWRVGDVVIERRVAMAHGRPAVGGGPPPGARRRAGAAGAGAALHVARRPRRADRAGAARSRDGGRRVRVRGRVPRRGARLDARRRLVRGAAAPRGGGPRPQDREDLWSAGRFAAELRPGEEAAVDRLGRGPGGRPARRPRRSWRRRARAGPVRRGGRRSPTTTSTACWPSPPTRSSCGPDGRGRVPLVRRVVARHDDLVRGPVPRDGPGGGGPAGPAGAVGVAALRGDARQHHRQRQPRVQHGGRDPLVRPRAGAARAGHRRRRPGGARGAGAARGDRRARRRDPVRDPRRSRRRPPDPGRARRGAHVDGRPHRRGAGHAARRGKPVEVNALWIEALAVAQELRRAHRRRRRRRAAWSAARARVVRGAVRRATARTPGRGGRPGGDDAAVRPNPLLAVVAAARAAARRGAGRPRGRERAADVARPAVAGARRARLPGPPPRRPRRARRARTTRAPCGRGSSGRTSRRRSGPASRWTGVVDGLEAHLSEWGLGSVSETADGDAPHGATGCPFQAWSVAEVLRARRLARGRAAAGQV